MSNRLPTVEALRAFGAISVLWMHCIWLGPWDFPRGLGAWFHHGWLGVDLFLIISGFATTRALFQGQNSAQTHPGWALGRLELRYLPLAFAGVVSTQKKQLRWCVTFSIDAEHHCNRGGSKLSLV